MSERLQLIERNAWERYRKALARAQRQPNATTKLAAIDAGAAWERADGNLHDHARRLAQIARAGRL